MFFCFKQKTAYEMRISDWSSDVCSSDLATGATDAQWIKDAQDIWRSSGKSLPDACDPAFAALAAKGGLSPELRWERIELAATQWQPGVMREIGRASCRERVCQYGSISVVAVSLKKKHKKKINKKK